MTAARTPDAAHATPGILFVAPRFHTNLFFATKALVKAGYRVAVFAQKSEPPEDHSFVTPRIFPRGTKYPEVRTAVQEFRPGLALLRRTRPASFHVERAGRFGRLKIWHYDLRPLTSHRGLFKRAEWWIQGLPSRRVTPKPGLDPALPSEPDASYLPWPVESDPAVTRAPRDGPLRLLCVGKLMQPRKNQDKLIDAARDLLASGRATLTLAGSSSAGAARTDVDHYTGLRRAAEIFPGRVRILEDVPFDRMPQLYASHDVCVLPARNEPLGFAPVEAMAYGCVPVLSEGCGSAGYLTHGVNGYRVATGDAADLHAVLEILAGDDGLVDRIGMAAKKLAETDLSPARFVERIEALMAEDKT